VAVTHFVYVGDTEPVLVNGIVVGIVEGDRVAVTHFV
jgi:hypothetical protein